MNKNTLWSLRLIFSEKQSKGIEQNGLRFHEDWNQ